MENHNASKIRFRRPARTWWERYLRGTISREEWDVIRVKLAAGEVAEPDVSGIDAYLDNLEAAYA